MHDIYEASESTCRSLKGNELLVQEYLNFRNILDDEAKSTLALYTT